MPLAPGKNLLHYQVAGRIGEGGMGAVYRATDTRLNREVALKVLPAEVASDSARLERFRREARAVAALDHPHIVTIHSVEKDGDTHFLIMELVEGTTLDQMLAPGGLPLARVFDIGIALADALAAAHQKGIVHRDLKPGNVMLGRDGRVKVLDFGLAKPEGEDSAIHAEQAATHVPTTETPPGATLTEAGTVMGTKPYMSPEQLRGQAVDHRTDIFALGVVLYEICTGQRPFTGRTSVDLVSAIMRDTPQPVTSARHDVPRQLARIIDHCLKKSVTERFQSALDIRNELRELRAEIDSGASAAAGSGSPVGGVAPDTSGPGAARPPRSAGWSTPPSDTAGPAWSGPVSGPMTPTSGALPAAGGTRTLLWGALAGAALVIVVLVAYWLGRSSDGPAVVGAARPDIGAAESTGAAAAPAAATVSLAVLPFRNLTPDADQEYFADGLSEELMGVLGRIPGLQVAGRVSSFSFKGKNAAPAAVGEQLGVAYILDGSVRKAGDQIRVTVQLVDAANGFQLWSRTYDRTVEDVFAVQDDIARAVAAALEVTLLGEADAGSVSQADATAYDLVLQARYVMRTPAEDNLRRARELLERAVAIAPDYAPAWAEKGLLHNREVSLATTARDRQRIYEQARTTLQKALELDPDLAEAHSRIASVQSDRDWDFAAAGRSTARALELDPTNPVVMGNAANYFGLMGRLDEAIAVQERFLRIDPLSTTGYWNLGRSYLHAGRLEEAESTLREGLDLAPDHFWLRYHLGLALLEQHRIDEARVALDSALELIGGNEFYELNVRALTAHYAGDSAAADEAIAELEEEHCDASPETCAQMAALRNRPDEAFAWLEKSLALREPTLPYGRSDPLLARLRDDPHWDPFWQKVGFPPAE